MIIKVNVNTDFFVSELCTFHTKEEIFELIKSIDLEIGEYEFTRDLRDYFISEMEKEDELNEEY